MSILTNYGTRRDLLVGQQFNLSSAYNPNYPLIFPNLVRWYKGDSFSLANNSAVGVSGNSWIDNSNNKDHLYSKSNTIFPTLVNNVQNNLPAINFFNEASGIFVSGSGITVTPDWTVMMLYSGTYTGGTSIYGVVPFAGNVTDIQLTTSSGFNIFDRAGAGLTTINHSSMGKVKYLGFSVTGNNAIISAISYPSVNNLIQTSIGTAHTQPRTGTYSRIGRTTTSWNQPFSGYIFEILLYETGMRTGLIRDFLNDYFRPKWGLT